MSTSNIAEMERRPETSKCSRSQMRRNIVQSQQQNRVKQKAVVNEIKPSQNAITLEQYFKGVNFKVVEIEEEDWDSDLQTQEINKFSLSEAKNNNFRISRTNTKGTNRNKTNTKQQDQQIIGVQEYLSGRNDLIQRQVGNSMGPNININAPNYSQMNFHQMKVQGSPQIMKNKQNKEMLEAKTKQMMATSKDFFGCGGDMLRRTHYDKDKLSKMKQQVDQRFQKEEQELLTKYATKFNIFQEPARQSYTLKEIYGKLK